MKNLLLLSWALVIMSGCLSSEPEPEEVMEEEEVILELPESDRIVTVKDFYSPPAGEQKGSKAYPVLYLTDGRNAFTPGGQFGSVEVERSYQRLVDEGKIREAILVGIHNTSIREKEYTPTVDSKRRGGEADKFLDFIADTLMEYMSSQYRVLKGPENTAIMGSSYGGLLSFYAGWTRPQVFGMAGCLSSSFWWDNQALLRTVKEAPIPVLRSKFYLDMGTLEGRGAVDDTLFMANSLVEKGWKLGDNLMLVVDPAGKHSESYWKARVAVALEFFFGPKAD